MVPSSVKYFSGSIVPSLVVKSDVKLYCPAISEATFSTSEEYTPISDYYFYDPNCIIPDTETAVPKLCSFNPEAKINVDAPKVKGLQIVDGKNLRQYRNIFLDSGCSDRI